MGKEEKKLDLLIIGAGPAGLTAAIYAGRLKLNTLLLEDAIIGGQIKDTYLVENYPGFKAITGSDLGDKFYEQAQHLGARIDEFDKIISVKLTDDEKVVETETYIYKPDTVIIATGSKHRELPIDEEAKFHGNGVHYCEICDGQMYEGKDLAVVGGGNSAVEGAIFLSRYAKSVTVIHQFDNFQADESNQQELFKNPKIKVIWDSEIRHALGKGKVQGISIENLKTKELSEIKVHGIFVYIGMIPKTDLFKEYININEYGYIEAGETTETNVKGVFVAGDVRTKMFRQLTTATGDGTVASLMAERYIVEKKKSKMLK